MKSIAETTALIPEGVAMGAVDWVLHQWYESRFNKSLLKWIPDNAEAYQKQTDYLIGVLAYKAELAFRFNGSFHAAIVQADMKGSLDSVNFMRKEMARWLISDYVSIVDPQCASWLRVAIEVDKS